MGKIAGWIAGWLALGLAACAGPTPSPSPTAAPSPEASPTATPTATPAATPDLQRILFPTPEDWSKGAAEARVTFIEWGDFQCPYCGQLAPLLRRLVDAYPNEVRVVYRHFPLRTIHDKAMITAEASEAAGAQGKFWEMHDWLFDHQAEWINSSNITETLVSAARSLGLDEERFRRDLEEGRYRAKVETAYAEAVALGLPGTPFLLVNGQPWPQGLNYLEYAHLEAMVKLARLRERQFDAPPPMGIDPARRYRAVLKTEKGDIVIELFADRAPVTVNNFVFLARQGWYNDITFHYVITDVVAVTGDPSGTGFGGPGYAIPDEITETLKFDAPGMVGLLNAGPDTGGSQFFITMTPLPQLDGRYTLFGRVVEGMEVVRALRPRDPQVDPDAPPGDRLLAVIIEEN